MKVDFAVERDSSSLEFRLLDNVPPSLLPVVEGVRRVISDLPRSPSLLNAAEKGTGSCDLFVHAKGRTYTTIWTAKHPMSLACKSCTNVQRPCMRIKEGRLLVLPLPTLIRWKDTPHADEPVGPQDLGYWVTRQGFNSRKTKSNPEGTIDLWEK